MVLFFQFCACLHIKHSIIETTAKSEILKEKTYERVATLRVLVELIFTSITNWNKYIIIANVNRRLKLSKK